MVRMTIPRGVVRTDGRALLMAAAWQELADVGPAALSLRAVARRAGVSHAAPKHHFKDRTGLLTALAVVGFRDLRDRLEAAVAASSPGRLDRLAAIGRAYLDFSLAEPAVFEVMFGTEPLHEDDPGLAEQRRSAFAVLNALVSGAEPGAEPAPQPVPVESLMTFSMIHGLVILTRDGSLQRITGTATPDATAALARSLTASFTEQLGILLEARSIRR
jgi:AcrR family transcriptional regulator